jgi:hypothetical protein
MFLLLISYVCETCEKPLAQANPIDSLEMEYVCDFTASKCSTMATWAYQKIDGVGFYYDPEYVKKRQFSDCIFQIGLIASSRCVFDKENIQDLLILFRHPPIDFDEVIGGVNFKYQKAASVLIIKNQWTFGHNAMQKIYDFFKPLVDRAP